jgi:hypothetical protein
MTTKFHLDAKESARHESAVKPDSAIEVEITRSTASGGANADGSFELQLFRRNAVSSEWEMVGTSTLGIGAQARTVFDELTRGAEYTVGVFYKPSGDTIDSELSVDGTITTR